MCGLIEGTNLVLPGQTKEKYKNISHNNNPSKIKQPPENKTK